MEETTHEDEASAVRSVQLEDGSLLLYDPRNESAWIESDVSIVFP